MTTLEHISKQIRAAGMAAEQKESIETLPGGEGDGMGDDAFDPAELAKGIKVEMEHTQDANQAKEIAKDHLTEDPEYYQKLEKMEKEEGLQTQVFSRFCARPVRLAGSAYKRYTFMDTMIEVIREPITVNGQSKGAMYWARTEEGYKTGKYDDPSAAQAEAEDSIEKGSTRMARLSKSGSETSFEHRGQTCEIKWTTINEKGTDTTYRGVCSELGLSTRSFPTIAEAKSEIKKQVEQSEKEATHMARLMSDEEWKKQPNKKSASGATMYPAVIKGKQTWVTIPDKDETHMARLGMFEVYKTAKADPSYLAWKGEASSADDAVQRAYQSGKINIHQVKKYDEGMLKVVEKKGAPDRTDWRHANDNDTSPFGK
jgi:hypothetical protein